MKSFQISDTIEIWLLLCLSQFLHQHLIDILYRLAQSIRNFSCYSNIFIMSCSGTGCHRYKSSHMHSKRDHQKLPTTKKTSNTFKDPLAGCSEVGLCSCRFSTQSKIIIINSVKDSCEKNIAAALEDETTKDCEPPEDKRIKNVSRRLSSSKNFPSYEKYVKDLYNLSLRCDD